MFNEKHYFDQKMRKSRPKDALLKLVNTMKTVKIVKTVKTVVFIDRNCGDYGYCGEYRDCGDYGDYLKTT